MKHNHVIIIILAAIFVLSAKNAGAQASDFVFRPDSAAAYRWADSVLKTLTVKEKFGQMLMIRVYSNKDENEYAAVDKLIEDCQVGGVLFFQGTVAQQAKLTQRWRAKSKTPLFVSIDGETGLGMRLSDVEKFPLAITMGAVADNRLIFEAGKEVGRQCRKLGVHINYAPVADININSRNPVIGTRSFGEKTGNVARKTAAFALGMQSEGVIAVTKHFPGHGDTETDSHHALPVINHPAERLQKIEMYPFKYLIDKGISGVMLGHLNIPALDTLEKPSSLSAEIGTKILQDDLGFKGLIMTDGLDMKGVTSYAKPGAIEVEAFLAGNDILLIPPKPRTALDSLLSAYKNGVITEKELDKRCRKILFYKALYGVNLPDTIEKEEIAYLSNPPSGAIKDVYNAAATVLVNNDDAIPIDMRNIRKTLIVTYGTDKGDFVGAMRNYAPFRAVSYSEFVKNEKIADSVEVIVAAVFAGGRSEGSYGINQAHINHIKTIAQKKKVVLALYANPYAARLFDHPKIQGFVLGYENQPLSTGAIPNVLTGAFPAQGVLPVSTGNFSSGDGEIMDDRSNLRYAKTNELSINQTFIRQIDSLAQLGITKKAYPGCQILIAKDGKVFYHKAFGTMTFDEKTPVANDNIYDVASLTKILATTPAVMKLAEQGKIDIDRTLGYYLKFLKDTDKADLVIRDILAHQSGLTAWIPFYKKISDTAMYSAKKSADYSIQIADNMFMREDFKDSIFQMIASSELKSTAYRYSDLGMILLAEIVAQQSDMTFDEYLEKEIYQKMNLGTIGFKPLEKFPNDALVPTEQDGVWRNQLIHGYVHDMAAAMLGGVAGNAGLFANAWDVGAMMQMFLQNGFYNGQHIVPNRAVAEFTKQQFPLNDNRRALGFDKPAKSASASPVCASASKSSFGHSGFTGCFAWADPANGLVYVFLSNRIHPSSENTALTKLSIRSLIHEAAYNAVKPVK